MEKTHVESKSTTTGTSPWVFIPALLVALACLILAAAVGYMTLGYMKAVPAAVAAAAPVQPVAPSAPQGAAPVAPVANSDPAPVVTGVCPTEREFEILTGVRADIVREEPCAFHWRGDPATITAAHPCPDGFSCTLGSDGQNYVYTGDNSLGSMSIFAGTWRLIDLYPANDAVRNGCSFLKKVQAVGAISDPTWTASAGNFTCN